MTNPIGDRVIVKPVPEENKTASGLFIANASTATPKGTVVAVGPGRKTSEGVLVPMEVKVGDVILYASGSGIKTKINGEDLLFMTEDAILGILSED